MLRLVLSITSGFFAYQIVNDLMVAGVYATNENFLWTFVAGIKALCTALVLTVLWLIYIGFSLNDIGVYLEKKSHVLGQGSEGTAS